ncbi:MAG: hypothetical protein SFW09_10755, partial [Hyphomicrobiaceae bacterium]|nr:hypothetical protein [Hyphomicrobiaceae bacterium]
ISKFSRPLIARDPLHPPGERYLNRKRPGNAMSRRAMRHRKIASRGLGATREGAAKVQFFGRCSRARLKAEDRGSKCRHCVCRDIGKCSGYKPKVISPPDFGQIVEAEADRQYPPRDDLEMLRNPALLGR